MRVTLDKDRVHSSELEFLRAYFNIRWLSRGGTGFGANVSAHDEGYHFVAYGLDVTFEQSIELRRWLGDDPTRIAFDENPRGKPTQVLYTKKGENVISPLLFNTIVSKPFWSKTPKRVK